MVPLEPRCAQALGLTWFAQQATDRRMTLIGELVSSIRIIKMMGWEGTSKSRITDAREAELGAIKHRARVFGSEPPPSSRAKLTDRCHQWPYDLVDRHSSSRHPLHLRCFRVRHEARAHGVRRFHVDEPVRTPTGSSQYVLCQLL